MQESRGVMHVCSLSMSPLTIVRNDLKTVQEKYDLLSEEERENDQLLLFNINRLRWTELSMEYNRHIQLQYVYTHLGDKGEHPKFRQVKMRPLFRAWKREVLRQNWLDVRKALDVLSIDSRLNRKKDSFSQQRSLLAGKALAKLGFLAPAPVEGLVDVYGPLRFLNTFQTPAATNPGFINRELNYAESSAVRTISEAPVTETVDEEEQLNVELVKERLRKKGVVLQEDVPMRGHKRSYDDESSRESTRDSEAGVDERRRSFKQRKTASAAAAVEAEAKHKSEVRKKIGIILIIFVIAALIAIGVFSYIKYKRYQAFLIAQEACKNVPRPTPKKKGWFN